MDVVTRFAPSPTGTFHLGSYRTAIFSYLFARHHGGKFLLRIEDTDKARSTKEYEDNILESLDWLGLEYDEFHRQSEWVGKHEDILRDLVAQDVAYVSKETSDEGVEREVIRFRNPNRAVTFNDLIRGEITFDTTELGDFVIAKSFTEPLFHLVVVADDAAQGVTHIIRGEDHISNTPRQILLYEALGKPVPQYAHLPLVLAADRSKLSKRKGARALTEYRDSGFLPEAVLNYVAMLGWNPATEEELFTKSDLVERFTLDQVQKSGAAFDENKLRWFNREYLMKLDDERFKTDIKPFFTPELLKTLEANGRFEKLLPELRERIEVFGDIRTMEENGEFSYYAESPTYTPEELLWKKEPDKEAAKSHLERVRSLLEPLSPDSWTAEGVKSAIWAYAEEVGRGNVLWPLRYALSGREKSPDPFTLADILGKDETLTRISFAVELLSR